MKLPRINIYKCPYGCITVTVDVDEGVTPFFTQCRNRNTKERPIQKKYLDENGFCIAMAKSSFYPDGPKPAGIPDPEWEWYLPDAKEIESLCKKHPEASAEIRHRAKEQLYLRPRTNKEPKYHEVKT